jgi:hypothetical protein
MMLPKMSRAADGGFEEDGTFEQCDGVAVFGMDICQMCIDMANPEFVRSLSEPGAYEKLME